MARYEPPPRPTESVLRPTAQGGRPVRVAPPTPARQEPVPEEKPPRRYLPVVAVQSIACVVAVLLALLLRTAGGPAYEDLRQRFQESLWRNDLLATLAVLWDGEPLDSQPLTEEEGAVPGNADSTTDNTTDSTATTATQTTDTVETTTVAAPFGARLPPQGALAVPLRVNRLACLPVADGVLTSGYGYRQNPTGEGEQFHRGLDVAAPAGAPIAAMFYGQVAEIGESSSLGRYVRLSHGDGVEVLYAHCQQVMATQGAFVRPGDRVALVGDTGDSTGSHVHIQISCNGQVYNPCAILPTYDA